MLDLTKTIVAGRRLTCMMITHNMQSALEAGNRTIMMDDGRIVLDVSGEERANMTVQQLVARFRETAGRDLAVDRMLLG